MRARPTPLPGSVSSGPPRGAAPTPPGGRGPAARARNARRARGFTILELLLSAAITLVLAGIASDLFLRIQDLIAAGAANYEVVTTGGTAEHVVRDDFQRLNPQGFFVIQWGDSIQNPPLTPTGTPAFLPAVPGAPTVSGGAISAIAMTTNVGLGYWSTNPPRVAIIDPTGAGSGASAVAQVNATGNVTNIAVQVGGQNYSGSTYVVLDNFPWLAMRYNVDQISFLASGPWTTTRYNVQSNYSVPANIGATPPTNLIATGTTDSGLNRTFQSDVARIWYGHLLANTSNGTTLPGYVSPGYATDENGNTLAPPYWRLGRHALLLSPQSTVRYDGVLIDPSYGGAGAALLPYFNMGVVAPSTITGFIITSNGSGYSTPANLLLPSSLGSASATVPGPSSPISYPVTYTAGAQPSQPYYASQTLWQAVDYMYDPTTPVTTQGYYTGVQDGTSDIAMSSDVTTVRTAITSITPSSPAPQNSLNQAAWTTELPGQRMLDACFRVYGTPYVTTNISADSVMPTQSVLDANCSGFTVEVSYDGTFTDLPRPTGGAISITSVGTGGILTTGGIAVTAPGTNYYNLNYPIYIAVTQTGGGSGGLIAVSAPAAGNGIGTVTVVNPGTGYTTTGAVSIVPFFAAGYGLGNTPTVTGCSPWPRLVRITATLQDQHATIHNLNVTDPSIPDGRPFSYVLEVPQQ